MNSMNINDWQTIQTRNYVKEIKDTITKVKPTDWAVLADVTLLLAAFLLDKLFDNSQVPRVIWASLLISGVLLTVSFIVSEKQSERVKERSEKFLLPPKTIVALFDDEVCYKLMSAVSFLNHLKSVSEISSKETAALAEFYCVETLYYLNKSVSLLTVISSNLSNAVSLDMDAGPEKISIYRLENVCRLIASIYDDTLLSIEKINATEKTYKIELNVQVETAKVYREGFNSFEAQVYSIKEDLLT